MRTRGTAATATHLVRKTAALDPDFIVTVLVPVFALIGVLGTITTNAHARTRRHLVRTAIDSRTRGRTVRAQAHALTGERGASTPTPGTTRTHDTAEIQRLYDTAEVDGLFDDADRLDRASIVATDLHRQTPAASAAVLMSSVGWFAATVIVGRLALGLHHAAMSLDTGVIDTTAVIAGFGAVIYLAVAATYLHSYRMLVHDRAALAEQSPARSAPAPR